MLALLCLAVSLTSTAAWVLPGSKFKEKNLASFLKSGETNTLFFSPFLFTPIALPVQYKDGSVVELKVNKITSLKHVLGYPHYSLGFCKVSIKNHPLISLTSLISPHPNCY